MSVLSEKEKFLLESFHDGQQGVLDAWRTKKLLRRSAAQNYLRELRETKRLCGLAQESVERVSLWERVERRIEQEEHAELFLGRREVETGQSLSEQLVSVIDFFGSHRWRAVGAVATACVAAALYLGVTTDGRLSPENVASMGGADSSDSSTAVASNAMEGSGPVSVVSFEKEEETEILRTDRPRIIGEPRVDAIEVDWMRSDGRVRLIPGEEGRSIIWVKRRPMKVVPPKHWGENSVEKSRQGVARGIFVETTPAPSPQALFRESYQGTQ